MKSRTQLETENYELKQEVKRLKKIAQKAIDNANLKCENKIKELEQQFDVVTEQVKKLTEENSKKKADYDSLLNSYISLNIKLDESMNKLRILEKENKKLRNKLQKRDDKIKDINAKLKSDSHNSSKPSSSDGLKTVIHNHRKPTSNFQGGQVGHAFSTLELSDKPTRIIKLNRKRTCECGAKIIYLSSPEKRQKINMKITYELIEYDGYNGICPCCHKEYKANFPKDVTSKVQYDNSVKEFAIYLSDYANVPLRKIRSIIADFTGIEGPSIGSITNWKNEAYKIANNNIDYLKKQILKAKVIHTDETPMNVNGNKYHYAIGSFSENISVIEGFRNRRKASFDKMGILPKYKNINVSDHYSVYYSYDNYQKAECNVHVSRELISIIENTGRKGAKEFEELLMATKKEVEESENKKLSEERYEEIKAEFIEILDRWDEEFEQASKGKSKIYFDKERRLKNRLREYLENHILFAKISEVPFDNNPAEIGLRPSKSKLKVATLFRSEINYNGYCNMQGLLDTARKNNINKKYVIQELYNKNNKIFKGIQP